MHLEVVIERMWRHTWRPRSSELIDALRDRDRAGLEMHLEAMAVRTWRPGSRKFGDRHLEAVIDRVWRCTWRP